MDPMDHGKTVKRSTVAISSSKNRLSGTSDLREAGTRCALLKRQMIEPRTADSCFGLARAG
jgi:hypothetical protein